MKKPTPAFSWDALDALRVAEGLVHEQRRGGVTSNEYAAQYGLSRWLATAQLARLVSSGAMECQMGRTPDAAGRNILSRVYYPAKEGGVCGGSANVGSKRTNGIERAANRAK